METELVEVEPSRPNVMGTLRGSGGGKSLMLNGHTDTVGTDYMTIDPFDPVIKGGKLYGRGSFDMKGGLASSMAAVKAIVDSGDQSRGDVDIAAVCDEEFASIGTEHLMKDTRVDAAIIGEPTFFNIQVAHKGFAWIDVTTHGIAAHGSMYQFGVDAIAKMGHFLIGIEAIQSILEETKHHLVGSGSIHANIISGGVELSTYPDRCKLEAERRLIPGETREDVEDEMKSLIKHQGGGPQVQSRLRDHILQGANGDQPREEICQVLKQGSLEVLGKEPQWVGGSGWMDTQIIHGREYRLSLSVQAGLGHTGQRSGLTWTRSSRPLRSRSTS